MFGIEAKTFYAVLCKDDATIKFKLIKAPSTGFCGSWQCLSATLIVVATVGVGKPRAAKHMFADFKKSVVRPGVFLVEGARRHRGFYNKVKVSPSLCVVR